MFWDNPETAPPRVRRDETLMQEIRRVFDENFQVYGVRKVWRQLWREGRQTARCTVARLMKKMALQGVIRGKRVRTTVSDKAKPCPLDHVNRQFKAPRPNVLWVSDFTYVATWGGFAYVAFVIDAYARRIVGWRVSRSAHAGFVLDALEQAIHNRKPVSGGLVHHSDRGVQYLSIKYTERLAQAGLVPSVGSVGDSYDNALAETINGLYKAEVIHRCGPWRMLEAVEYATLEWVDWFNNRRSLEPIGHVPPAEAEAHLRSDQENSRLTHTKQPPKKPERFKVNLACPAQRSSFVLIIRQRVCVGLTQRRQGGYCRWRGFTKAAAGPRQPELPGSACKERSLQSFLRRKGRLGGLRQVSPECRDRPARPRDPVSPCCRGRAPRPHRPSRLARLLPARQSMPRRKS